MRSTALVASLLLLSIAGSADAQEHHLGGAAMNAGSSQAPYAGLQQRTIKALSAEQIADLRAGRGMGLALAAELNGYPGPSHALELADPLGLSPDQRTRTAAALAAMKAETVAIGHEVIAAETELDRQFAGRTATPESLDDTVMRIAATQGKLRAAHLRYHLQMATILTPEQAMTYARLRGYAPDQPGQAPRH